MPTSSPTDAGSALYKPPSGSTPIKSGTTIAGYVLPDGRHVTAGGLPLPSGSIVVYGPKGIIGWKIGGASGQQVSLTDIDSYLSKMPSQSVSTTGTTASAPKPVTATSTSTGAVSATSAASASTVTDLNKFARDLLAGLGITANPRNVAAILAWAQAERRASGRPDGFNPLNTTQSWSGATNFNSVGVKNYPTYEAGLQATIKTLKNGRYQPVLDALSKDPGSLGDALSVTPWGTSGTNVTRILSSGKVQNVVLTGSGGSTNAGTVAYSGSVGGGTYTASGGATGGTGAGMPSWDSATYQTALESSGFAAGLIKSDPSLTLLFQTAVQKQWEPGGAEFQAALQNTAWWKSRSANQRTWDELIWQDNAQAHRLLETQKASIAARAAQLGVTLTDVALTHITHVAARNGLSDQEIRSMISAQSKYTPTGVYGGTLGETLTQLKQMALAYNVPVSDTQLQQFSQAVVAGTADVGKWQDWFKQQAISKYPWLKSQLDSGLTVAQIADPYKQMMAQYLEVDPDTIKMTDPMLGKGLQYHDASGKADGYATMPLWMFEQQVRQDPRWLKTDNARNSVMDTGIGVLKDFGLVS